MSLCEICASIIEIYPSLLSQKLRVDMQAIVLGKYLMLDMRLLLLMAKVSFQQLLGLGILKLDRVILKKLQ